jgi:two-component system alkaline phosphatase synthesis response regulator PhoP
MINLDSESPLILVVDDEKPLTQAISYSLSREGWRVEIAVDGQEAIAMAQALDPSVIVLDVMLPGLDGLQVCRAVRAKSDVPILFLSARGEDVDRIVGLEIGGDDYLSKPFVMRELVARVRANLRRSSHGWIKPTQKTERYASASTGTIADSRLESGNLTVDVAAHVVRKNGSPVAVKPKEFDLLAYFLRHPGTTLSRDSLLREVWKYDVAVDTRTVDVHVRGLRQKIEHDPSKPELIETVRGYGYRFNRTAE